MERRLYVVYDSEAGIYGPPIEGRNDVVAMRHFQDGLKNSPLPQDMKDQLILFFWGTMDDETGIFVQDTTQVPFLALKNPEDLTDVM